MIFLIESSVILILMSCMFYLLCAKKVHTSSTSYLASSAHCYKDCFPSPWKNSGETEGAEHIVHAVKFTCSRTLTGWRFVAQRVSGQGRDDYPKLQVWRPQSGSPITYDIVHSVRVLANHRAPVRATCTHTLSHHTRLEMFLACINLHPILQPIIFSL